MPPIDPDTFSWGIPGYHGQTFNASYPHTGGMKQQFVLPGGPPGAVKAASKKRAAARAKRAAEVELKRKRIPGDPQIGQDAGYSIPGQEPKFKVPAKISLGKSVHHDVLKDWVKSLTQSSKFEVQFGCDWVAVPNKRQTSFHCFRHNMSSFGRGMGLITLKDSEGADLPLKLQTWHQDETLHSGWTTLVPGVYQPVAGNTMNAAWPGWMGDSPAGLAQRWISEVGTPYSVVPLNCMLKPSNKTTTLVTNVQQQRIQTDTNLPGGYANGVIVPQTVYSPYIEQRANTVYYAPVNISDLEDESFVNNRIIATSTSDGPNMNSAMQIASLRTEAHRCRSLIAQQNLQFNTTDGYVEDYFSKFFGPNELTSFENKINESDASRKQYKAVLKGGNVNYKFINKGDGPAKVDIIIWKYKATHVAPPCYNRGTTDTGGSTLRNTDSRYYMQLKSNGGVYGTGDPPPAGSPALTCNAINDLLCRYSEAYMRTCTEHFGSDAMSGRIPVGVTVDPDTGTVTGLDCDIINDPHFPLFKKYSKYFQESLCDFSEHSRYSYNLDAGQRQSVDIGLPGEHYNPCKVSQNPLPNTAGAVAAAGGSHASGYYLGAANQGFPTDYKHQSPIAPYNKFTYFVMVSVSGVNMNATYERHQNDQSWSAQTVPVDPPTVPATYTNQWVPAASEMLTSPASIEVGTAFSGAHVQALCKYTERIGACSASMTKGPLYNNGACDFPELFSETDQAGPNPFPTWAKDTMDLVIGPKLDMSQTVRLPKTRTFTKRPPPNRGTTTFSDSSTVATNWGTTTGPSEIDTSSGDRAAARQSTEEL